jgi:hypothetical protein
MKAAIFKGPGEIEIGDRPDPVIKESTDAVVRVVLACVCGSDLWYYRGETDFPADSPILVVAAVPTGEYSSTSIPSKCVDIGLERGRGDAVGSQLTDQVVELLTVPRDQRGVIPVRAEGARDREPQVRSGTDDGNGWHWFTFHQMGRAICVAGLAGDLFR